MRLGAEMLRRLRGGVPVLPYLSLFQRPHNSPTRRGVHERNWMVLDGTGLDWTGFLCSGLD